MKITVSVVLVALGVIAFAIASAIGFGFVDDRDIAEDYAGWLALGSVFFAASFLPWSR